MKTYEWIIKIIAYIVCLCAVCAGFSLKERDARDTLEKYIRSEEERKTSELCGILVRLKESLSACVSDNADVEAYTEAVYCCKAASDAVCAVDGGKNSEPLRLFFDRVKNVCDGIYKNGEQITSLNVRPVSELYIRLCAAEDALLSGRSSAAELIELLSAGLSAPEISQNEKIPDRISVNRAEKYAYKHIGRGVRLKNCGICDGHFIFASDSSCIILAKKGEPFFKSRTVTFGAEHINAVTAADTAEKYIFELTGKPCKARLEDKIFGRYYFTVFCDKKEYPVGVDKTDGSIVFYVISP